MNERNSHMCTINLLNRIRSLHPLSRARTTDGAKNTISRGGFTMVEVLVVLVIGSILTAIAVPSVINFLQKYRLEGATRVIWSDMQSAKMSAVKANQSVSVQLLTSTSYSYSYTDGLAATHSFYRDLSDEYPGVTVGFSTGTSITFRSMGMGQPGTTKTVTLQNGFGSRSFAINWTGRIESL
jgi:type IV fimbrial biogenesis protein FimT